MNSNASIKKTIKVTLLPINHFFTVKNQVQSPYLLNNFKIMATLSINTIKVAITSYVCVFCMYDCLEGVNTPPLNGTPSPCHADTSKKNYQNDDAFLNSSML